MTGELDDKKAIFLTVHDIGFNHRLVLYQNGKKERRSTFLLFFHFSLDQ